MKINELKNKKVGICVSAGIDSKSVTKRLVEEGINVVYFTADLNQPDEINTNDMVKKNRILWS